MHRGVALAIVMLLVTTLPPTSGGADPAREGCTVEDQGYCVQVTLQDLVLDCTLSDATHTCVTSTTVVLAATGPAGIPGKARLSFDFWYFACDDGEAPCDSDFVAEKRTCGWTDEGGCSIEVPVYAETVRTGVGPDVCPYRYVDIWASGAALTPLSNVVLASSGSIWVDSWSDPCNPENEW